MIRGLDGVLLSTENTKKLSDFYKDVVGLKLGGEFEMEDGKVGYSFEEVRLYINPHSEVHGKTKEKNRIILNFEVDDAEKEAKRLKEKGAKIVQDVYHVEGYGLVSTFEDPDGNYFQLVQVRPSSN